MVVYFSGTGNSRHCAERLASALGDELLDAAGYLRRQIAAELISDRPWVFVCPTYAWQIPQAFEKFIRSGWFQGSREAYFVLTCGGESGGAAERIGALCTEVGLTFLGAVDVVMPDNFIIMLHAPEDEEVRQIVAGAQPTLDRAAACIREGRPFPVKKTRLLDRLKSGPINRGFRQLYIRADKFFTTDACVGCGRCEERCPLGNVRLEDGRPVWGELCALCLACICGCPEAAIEYGKHTRGKRRYQCPTLGDAP